MALPLTVSSYGEEIQVEPVPCGYEELQAFAQNVYQLVLVDVIRNYRVTSFEPPNDKQDTTMPLAEKPTVQSCLYERV